MQFFYNFFSNFSSILKSENSSNLSELISPLVLAAWSFGSVFLFCEFGIKVTNAFEEFGDELYQCKWYSFSTETQQMMVTFLAETQDPAFVRGYCNIVCLRDSFKKARSTVFFFTLYRSKGDLKLTKIQSFHSVLDNSCGFFLFYDTSPNQCLNIFILH